MWQKTRKPVFLLLVLMVMTAGGCQVRHCLHNDYYRDQPGICGKIYRMQEAKQRFSAVGLPAAYLLLGLVFLPVLLWLVFRILRACLRWCVRWIDRMVPRE